MTAVIFMGSYAYGSCNDQAKMCTLKINAIKEAVIPVENYLAQFVSIKVKAPFNDFLLKIKEKLETLQRKMDELPRNSQNDLSKEVDELMDYVFQQFNVLYNIFKKYNGKPDNQALNFAAEIKKEFDIEKIFSILVNKLKTLKNKAANLPDKELAEEITALITIIEKKKNNWNTKSNAELFAGITHRMKCV